MKAGTNYIQYSNSGTEIFSPRRLKTLFSAAIFLTVLILAESFVVTRMNIKDARYEQWDCQRYLALAERSPGTLASEGPFCWRILEPLLIRILPFSPSNGFYVLSITFLILSGIAFVLYAQSLGCSEYETWIALSFFVFSRWITGYLLFDYALVDSMAFFFILVAIWLVEIRANILFLIAALVVGCMVKEQVFIAACYSSVLLLKRSGLSKNNFIMSFSPVAAVFFILLILHMTISPSNNYSIIREMIHRFTSPAPLGYFHYTVFAWLKFLYDFIFTAWGVVPLLLFLQFKKTAQLLQKKPETFIFILAAFLQPLVAWNLERTLVYAFPVIFTLAVQSTRDIQIEKQLSQKRILAVFAVLNVVLFVRSVLLLRGMEIFTIRKLMFSLFFQ